MYKGKLIIYSSPPTQAAQDAMQPVEPAGTVSRVQVVQLPGSARMKLKNQK